MLEKQFHTLLAKYKRAVEKAGENSYMAKQIAQDIAHFCLKHTEVIVDETL